MRLLRAIRHIGILNFILLLVSFFGIMTCIFITIGLQDMHTPTFSDIADDRKETTPFETLTEKQLKEGEMVEGKILFNMGDFTNSIDDNQERYTHYAVLLGDKVMSIAIYDINDNASLRRQALSYAQYLAQNDLNIWQYHDENNSSTKKKKKAKKNKKTAKQIIQERMEHELGVSFKGKIVKIDTVIEEALKKHLTPEGENEPVFEVIPYEIKSIRPVDLGGLILSYALVALIGIVGIAALCILILRIRAHKFFP